MAVAVDISGSRYLSFSPLNEKHNILYRGVRNSFNQRYKQKPWFRLNPFTDKGVGKGETIERYDPQHDAGLSLLQSLVIVEDYFSDTPQLIKEFNISEFWDFLFSDSWSSGHYVRVFEGQLLDMISSCLLSLSNSRKLVQHETKAFAKNSRLKYASIRPETKAISPKLYCSQGDTSDSRSSSFVENFQTETEQIPFTETLLLKFIYYGHVIKPAFYDPESSVGYPDMTTTATNSSWLPETVDIDSLGYGETNSAICLRTSDIKSPSPPPVEAKGLKQHPRKRRVRASKDTFFQLENERVVMAKFISHNDNLIPNPPIPRGSNYRYTCSNFSNASDDYKSLPPKVDLNDFICTEKVTYLGEKVTYLGEFKVPMEYCNSASEDDDEDEENFGQQYYLGDTDRSIREDIFDSAMMKLKKRKDIIQKDRESKKQHIPKSRDKIMPEFSELDVRKYVKEHEVPKIIQVPESDTVPTFEEYAESLDADSKREAKNRVRRMTSKIGKKSTLNVGKFGGVLMQTGLKVGTNVKSSAQRMLIFEQLMKGRRKKQETSKRTNTIVVPLIYITMPSGLTFLHPISRPLWQLKIEEDRQKRQEASKQLNKTRRKSLLPTSGTALFNELTKVRLASKANVSKTGPTFPKIKMISSNESIESPDEQDSDEDIDVIDTDVFDSKKLNIKYSKDRIRKAKAARRAEEKKNKSHIYDLLKKYCRMQSIFKAFGGPAKKRRRSSVAAISSVNRKKEETEFSATNMRQRGCKM